MPAWLPSVRALFLLFVFAILLISSATTSGWLGGTAAWAGLETTGRWTDTTSAVPWGHMQIHVALMRGERVPPITTGYHSKILSWAAFNTTLGRLEASFWGWNPGGNLADQNCAGYPSSRLTSLSLDLTNIPSLFCAGHATLADGNLLVTGGDDGANVGLWDSYVFRPNPTGGQTRWERMGNMDQERWYPSNVALPDGNMMVFGGGRFAQMFVFGGTESPLQSSHTNRRNVERLGLTAMGRWSSAIPYDGTSNWPQAREGHSAVWFPHVKHMVIFGGRGDGDGSTQYNNLYRLKLSSYWYNDLVDRYEYVWTPIIPEAPQGLPEARDRHSAVMISDNTMVVYGGRRHTGSPLSDVRLLTTSISGGTPPETTWTWSEVTPPGGPGARYGHAAVFDPSGNRMLVFGGRNNGGVVNNQDVYALSSSGAWSTLTLTTGSPRPAAREGHTWVVDPYLRDSPLDAVGPNNDRRFVLFGGKGDDGVRRKDAWALWIHENGNATWQSVADSVPGMSGVTRHGAMWDLSELSEHGHGKSHDRMLVFGGETATGAQSVLWDMDGDTLSSPRWTQRNGHPLLALAGHTALHYIGHDRTTHFLDAPKVEEYNAGTGQWAVRDTAQILWAYPHVFLLPSGNIFSSGPEPQSKRYTRTATPAQWLASPTNPGYIFGDAAVMYRPDQILRSGNPGGINNYPITGSAEKIAFGANDATSGWQSAGTMLARSGQNLTVLPDGKVLVTGGLKGEDFRQNVTNNPPERRPQIWNPATGVWSDSVGASALAEDPAWKRAYHSTAILLPDARIMTAGGEVPTVSDPGYNPTWDRPTIFCPPYLFNPGGNLATRPTIYAWHDTLGYNQSFRIWTESPDSIMSICLIRPGAVTHGFGQDQRYVPLSFTVVQEPGYCPEIEATSPADNRLAPPGDYLLFIVKRSPFDVASPPDTVVPSIAEWVRLRNSSGAPIIGYAPPGCSGGGCPMVDTYTEAGWTAENTILGRSSDGSLATDVYRLKHAGTAGTGTLRLRIRESEQEETTLDHARLMAVDHDPGLRALASSQGFVLGERRAAWRVTRENGEDVTALVNGNGGRFRGRPGDVLLVDLLAPGEEPSSPWASAEGGVMEFEEKQGPAPGGGASLRPAGGPTPAAIDAAILDGSGILVQVPAGSGEWRTLERRYPREHMDEALVAGGSFTKLRLVFVGHHGLGFVGRLAIVGQVTGSEQTGLIARHSGRGDVADLLGSIDGRSTRLIPGDEVELAFQISTPPAGKVRDYFLVTHGVYTALVTTPDVPSTLPRRFALHQNRPNPFAGTTTIGFDLPVSSHVRLEIFDLQGRRVKELVNAGFAPGRHTVEWNHRTDQGGAARAGVYLYRLTAGSFRVQRTMTMVP